MSTILAQFTSSPGPTIRPLTIANLRSGECKMVPSTASNGTGGGSAGGGVAHTAGGAADDTTGPAGNVGGFAVVAADGVGACGGGVVTGDAALSTAGGADGVGGTIGDGVVRAISSGDVDCHHRLCSMAQPAPSPVAMPATTAARANTTRRFRQ